MAEQLTYALITPHSLLKSRTGGILSRLLYRSGMDLVAARLFAPSAELVREYAATVRLEGVSRQEARVLQIIKDYLLTRLMPDPKTGRRRRALLLLFKGENAVENISKIVGPISMQPRTGELVRDTYGDLVLNETGEVVYFEPAVLAPQTVAEAEEDIKIWARYSDKDGGLLENVIEYSAGAVVERTLVMIKPDNFQFASGRPGNILDMFSGTGLFIVAFKVHHMSVAEAEEFYGPVREVLRKKAAEDLTEKLRGLLQRELGFAPPQETEQRLVELLATPAAEHRFNRIVEFMTGRSPYRCSEKDKQLPGLTKCIILIYEGPNAVKKIRNILGPTDPRAAPPGTIRRELGSDVMINAAHASDSLENARREMQILRVAENNFKQTVEEVYGKL